MTAVIESLDALGELVGKEVGVSEFLEVPQDRIDTFARATGDRQWIHIDSERAQRESPYRRTIAHGFLTLSLLSPMLGSTIHLQGISMAVNYGLNRVRFPSPVPSGSRVRGRFTLKSLETIRGGVQAEWAVTVECEGSSKPCCAADWLVRYYA